MKRNRPSFFILVSFIAHLSLALGLYLWIKNSHPVRPQFISFTFSELSETESSTKTAMTGSKVASKKQKFSLAKWTPQFKFGATASAGSSSGEGQLTASSENLKESFNDYPLVKALYERIDQSFSYAGTEVGKKQIQGSMNLKLKIRRGGRVEIIESSTATPPELTGFILDQIAKALEKSLNTVTVENSVVIYLHVDLTQLTDESFIQAGRENISGHQVNIFKYAIKPKYVQANELSASGDPAMGIGVSVNVLAVWKLLFGSEKPNNRIEWDIEYRKQEFVRACEAQSAEGGCYKAGLIERALGHHQEAKRLIQRACELHLEDACKWLSENG